MRILLFTFIFLGFALTLNAQGTVTFQENFFNNNRYKIDSREVKPDEVALLMVKFENSQKEFVEGVKQMRIGSGLRILSLAGLAGGLIYGLTNANDPNALETYFLISIPSAVMGVIGNGIRQRGKQRVETGIAEYNFMKGQELIYPKQLSLQVKSGRLGLVYKF